MLIVGLRKGRLVSLFGFGLFKRFALSAPCLFMVVLYSFFSFLLSFLLPFPSLPSFLPCFLPSVPLSLLLSFLLSFY